MTLNWEWQLCEGQQVAPTMHRSALGTKVGNFEACVVNLALGVIRTNGASRPLEYAEQPNMVIFMAEYLYGPIT